MYGSWRKGCGAPFSAEWPSGFAAPSTVQFGCKVSNGVDRLDLAFLFRLFRIGLFR
jgi:hypothetical protein